MVSAARRRLAWGFVAVLAAAALASLVGAGLLLAERRGLVMLRRVPQVIAYALGNDEKGSEVAVINTDTSSGAFFLVFDQRDERQCVWSPARSIVLRRGPSARFISMFHDTSEIRLTGEERLFWPASVHWRLVNSRQRVTIERSDELRGPRVWISEQPGISFVPTPGLELRGRDVIGTYPVTTFAWDGAHTLAVDFDPSAPKSGFSPVKIGGAGREPTEALLVHDEDMQVIDERDR